MASSRKGLLGVVCNQGTAAFKNEKFCMSNGAIGDCRLISVGMRIRTRPNARYARANRHFLESGRGAGLD